MPRTATNFVQPLVLLRGLPWRKSDAALKKLKRMLWGFEALRIYDDKLERAVDEINQAQQKMVWELRRVRLIISLPSRLHDELTDRKRAATIVIKT